MIAKTDQAFFAKFGVNYLSNPGGEDGRVGWIAASVSLSSGVPSGAPVIPVNYNSGLKTSTGWDTFGTNTLRGDLGIFFTLDSAASWSANTAYGWVSDEFTIDKADLARVLEFTFDYRQTSGVLDASGTATQTIEVWIYNKNLNAWTQPAGFRGMNAGLNVSAQCQATFQTDSSSANNVYRVALLAMRTTGVTAPAKIYVDTMRVGPQTVNIGAPITDWQTYTPSLTNATGITNLSAWYRRVGDSYEIRANFAVSNAARSSTTTWKLTYPNGVTANTSIAQSLAGTTAHGFYEIYGDLTGSSLLFTQLDSVQITSDGITFNKRGANRALYDADFNSIGAAKYFSLEATVPVVGFSANVQMSSDTDTRVISSQAGRNATQSIPNQTFTVVNFDTLVYDLSGSMDVTTNKGRFTCPIAGIYSVKTSVEFTNNATGGRAIALYKNGVVYNNLSNCQVNSGAAPTTICGTTSVSCKAGDYLEIYAYQASGGNLNLAPNGSSYTFCTFERLSGPAVVAASETVALRYTNTSQPSVANNNTSNYLGAWTKDYDTFNFGSALANTTASGNASATIPVSGKYLIIFSSLWNYGVAPTGNGYVDVQMFVNTSLVSIIGAITATTSQSQYLWVNGSETYNFKAGDVVAFKVENSGTGSTYTMNASGNWNHLSIIRVGN